MPDTWKQELQAAAKCLNSTMLLNLLEQIPVDTSVLAGAIESFMHDFRYDLILQMLGSES